MKSPDRTELFLAMARRLRLPGPTMQHLIKRLQQEPAPSDSFLESYGFAVTRSKNIKLQHGTKEPHFKEIPAMLVWLNRLFLRKKVSLLDAVKILIKATHVLHPSKRPPSQQKAPSSPRQAPVVRRTVATPKTRDKYGRKSRAEQDRSQADRLVERIHTKGSSLNRALCSLQKSLKDRTDD